MAEDRVPQMAEIAKDILTLSRNSLLVNFRFLDRALAAQNFQSAENIALASDGETVYYGIRYILAEFSAEPSRVTRDILHTVLHCVFRHSFIGKNVDRARWDLAADIAAENLINDLGAACVRAKREDRQRALTEVLKDELGEPLNAERIYRWLGEKGFSEEELEQERENFRGDGHGIWYGDRDPEAKYNRDVNLKRIWEDISRKMQTELETINRDSSPVLVQNLKSLNRSRRSYTEFLRRFAVQGEVMKLSEEEFDYNYYNYGMELYGDVPLIEPLEYSERKLLREFVIVIDTSGSVRGEIVQNFIQHTYDILMNRENFSASVNIFILQCDDEVREAVRIKNREEFARYIETMEIKGLGKTDFRPAFEFVDGLIESGELSELKGLIYFTDGFGTFPERCPPYETAFIIHSDGGAEPGIPDWAGHMTISEENILDRNFSNS